VRGRPRTARQILLAPAALALAACTLTAPPSDGYMLRQYKAHRAAFHRLQEGLCADARRWRAYAPEDFRGPAYALPATGEFGPWMTPAEIDAYKGLLAEIGASYAVVEETEPDCLVNVGLWSAPVRFTGGYWDSKNWYFGEHWRRKALPVASDGKRPIHAGHAKGAEAIAFRAPIDDAWSIVYYRTLGPDH
jgi:hypothetical protein